MKIPKEFKFVASYIKEHGKFYSGVVAVVLSSLIIAAIPYIYGRLVDIAIKPNSQMKIILGLIFLWLTLSFLSDWLGRYSSRQAYEITNDLTNEMQIDLFQHLINLPLKFHKEKKMGRVMRKIDRGINDLSNLIERTGFHFLPDILSFFVALIILLFAEWRLGLILVVSSAVYAAITMSYTKEITEKQKTMHRSWEKAYGYLWDSVLNVHSVKSSTNEDFERKRNTKYFTIAGNLYKKWRFVWQKMSFWQEMIFTVSFITVFSLGIIMLRQGFLTPGKLVMFVGYISLLTSPLSRLADQYRTASSAVTSLKRILKHYELAPEKDLDFAKEIEIKGNIIFNGVNFGYKKDQMILKDIFLNVKAGEIVAIVGESGVGKTTLVDLIGRYFLPKKGKIIIDGVDIKKIKLKSLRQQMALVPQEVLLFNDTIKNNIKYGDINSDDKKIIEAARAANAHEFIEKFPKKYEQIVGERGIKLSTGQKQRIAIARAILREPKILILDEATSALDSVSEKFVQEALEKLIKGRTTFIIAHRLSTIQRADKIVVLEKGRIAETGTHNELMRNSDGIYRNFWELQSAIQKVE